MMIHIQAPRCGLEKIRHWTPGNGQSPMDKISLDKSPRTKLLNYYSAVFTAGYGACPKWGGFCPWIYFDLLPGVFTSEGDLSSILDIDLSALIRSGTDFDTSSSSSLSSCSPLTSERFWLQPRPFLLPACQSYAPLLSVSLASEVQLQRGVDLLVYWTFTWTLKCKTATGNSILRSISCCFIWYVMRL